MTGRVLVFGTFDGLHEGHLFFLQKAKECGDTLIVAVARDAHVRQLKQKKPLQNEKQRLADVRHLEIVDEAWLSDPILGSFEIIERVSPDGIVLGYDQHELEKALLTFFHDHEKLSTIHLQYVSHMGRD